MLPAHLERQHPVQVDRCGVGRDGTRPTQRSDDLGQAATLFRGRAEQHRQ